eukprot:403336829
MSSAVVLAKQWLINLNRHFVIATSTHRPSLVFEHLEKETAYEEVAELIHHKAIENNEVINPIFQEYCLGVEKYLDQKLATSSDKSSQQNLENQANMYSRAIEDYLTLRRACFVELQIMDLNRVGVEKDLKGIIQQTARHVGLEMPKVWKQSIRDPFEKQTEQNK